jgi:phytoene desaturase
MKQNKTTIVIGSGVSGLACACLLAKRGYKVKVLEANNFIGGCCSTTEMDGYVFNNGAMAVIMPELLDFVFERLGVDRESVLRLRKITAPQRTYFEDGVSVTLHDNAQIKIEGKGVNEGQIQRDIQALLSRWDPISQALFKLPTQPPSLSNLLAKTWRHLPKLTGTVGSELNTLIKDEHLRAALMGYLSYAGGDTRKLPAPALIAIIVLLKQGYFIPEGGMGKITQALGGALESLGGEIKFNSRVSRIQVRNGSVTGVEVEGQGVVESDLVISSASGLITFGKLVDEAYVPAWMKRKVANAKLSMKGLYVQFGTRNKIETDAHLNYILPAPKEFLSGKNSLGLYSVPSVYTPEYAKQGSVIEVSPIATEEMSREELTQKALELLSRHNKLDIALTRSRTPEDFENEMNLYKGAIYGISPDSPLALFSHRTPIGGLFQTGQTTFPGFGVTPAAASGILCADEVLKK